MKGSGKSIIYVGAGGNIGSHAVGALARSGCVVRFTLVDPDVYESRNLASQDITARDVGRPKVEVLAARIRRIDPALRVEAIAEPVERVPLVRLRADVIATGLDGLSPRRWVSRAAWRLGIPLVDAGVRAEGQLARVDVFEPDPDAACLECGWNAQERAALDNRYPCDPPVAPAPTGAPAHLGVLAAGLQCKEIVKILTGATRHTPLGRQLLMDAAADRYYVSTRRRAPDCGFDHRPWSLQPLARGPGAITLREALRLVPSLIDQPARLRLDGDAFVHRLECPECNVSRRILFLAGRVDNAARVCPNCGASMVAPGIDTTDTLTLDQLAGVHRRLSLRALGLRAGDVFSIETSAGETHFEIGGR